MATDSLRPPGDAIEAPGDPAPVVGHGSGAEPRGRPQLGRERSGRAEGVGEGSVGGGGDLVDVGLEVLEEVVALVGGQVGEMAAHLVEVVGGSPLEDGFGGGGAHAAALPWVPSRSSRTSAK
jgi:hypothetical protein